MILDLSLRYIEHIVDGSSGLTCVGDRTKFVAMDNRLSYERLIDVKPLTENSSALIYGGRNELTLRKFYETHMREKGFIGSGRLQFVGFSFLGEAALPIDISTGTCLIVEPLQFGIDYARWYVTTKATSEAGITWSANSLDFRLELPDIQVHSIDETCLLLSAPAQDVYGHWLLDTVPRLYLLQTKLENTLPIYRHKLPGWAEICLRAFAVDPSTTQRLPEGLVKISTVVMPSATKAAYRLGMPLVRDAWLQFRLFVLEEFDRSSDCVPVSQRVFLSRRGRHASRRKISNQKELEIAALSRGYMIMVPELFSIPQQAAIMRCARAVVGEDGSALHNVIFCETNAVLGVVSTSERQNLWHMGIATALGHKVAYCQSEKSDSGAEIVSMAEFQNMLDAIEASLAV